MANAQIVQLADAIVTDLGAASLSVAFTASRSYLGVESLESLSAILVTVVPRQYLTIPSSRYTWQLDYQIDIAVRKQVTDDSTSPDAITRLAEEIFDYFKPDTHPVPTGRNEKMIAREWMQFCAFEELNERRVAGSFMRLTFRGSDGH